EFHIEVRDAAGQPLQDYQIIAEDGCRTLPAGEFGSCTLSLKYVEHSIGNNNLGYVNAFQLVDNSGAPSIKQPSDFTVRVQSGSSTQQFQGSSSGTLVRVPTTFAVSSLPIDGYFITKAGNCDAIQKGGTATCTLTSSYVNPNNASPNANAVLKFINIVDNTGASTPRQASDFEVTVKNEVF